MVRHHATVTRARREEQNRHRAAIIWFTGLSGVGKSTLAHEVEERLHRMLIRTTIKLVRAELVEARPPFDKLRANGG